MMNRISFINTCAAFRTDADHIIDRDSIVIMADKPVVKSVQD